VTRYTLTILLLVSFGLTLISQDLEKELQSQTWYWTGSINDTIPITLTNSKPDKFDFVATFKTSNRLILSFPTSEKTDSIFSYGIKKNYLFLAYENKDSLQNLTFIATISADKKMIALKRSMSIKATYPGRDTVTYDYFWLSKRGRTRDIFDKENIIVYSKISDSSKVTERTRGDFYQVRGDSLFIDTDGFISDHFGSTGRDTVPQHLKIVRLHNITKFYHEREQLNNITGWGIGLSVLSTLIVSPLVSLKKGGFNGERYLKVAGTSLASTVLFVTLRVGLSHKKMVIRHKRNSWKLW
jgi:hypothetical protein